MYHIHDIGKFSKYRNLANIGRRQISNLKILKLIENLNRTNKVLKYVYRKK